MDLETAIKRAEQTIAADDAVHDALEANGGAWGKIDLVTYGFAEDYKPSSYEVWRAYMSARMENELRQILHYYRATP